MSDKTTHAVHWSFWVISGAALIWSVMGCINFFMQMDAEVLASFSETARTLVEDRPAWATGAFALSQFGGALGGLLLLLRRAAAYYLFIASLLGVAVTVAHTLSLTGSRISLTPGEIAGYVVMALGMAAFLIWYAKQAESRGWIR
jgi:hypothetical protein